MKETSQNDNIVKKIREDVANSKKIKDTCFKYENNTIFYNDEVICEADDEVCILVKRLEDGHCKVLYIKEKNKALKEIRKRKIDFERNGRGEEIDDEFYVIFPPSEDLKNFLVAYTYINNFDIYYFEKFIDDLILEHPNYYKTQERNGYIIKDIFKNKKDIH